MGKIAQSSVALIVTLTPFVLFACATAASPPEDQVSLASGVTLAGSGGGGGDTLALNAITETFGFPATPVGNALTSRLALDMKGGGTPKALSASTEYLRAHASETAAELSAADERLAEDRYLARWHIVRTLVVLDLPEAVTSLGSIVNRPVPPERWAPVHEGASSVGEESMLRLRALEGLRFLALRGAPGAEGALRQAMKSPVLSVQRAAAQAFVAAGRRSPARLAEARTLLPASRWAWLDLRPVTDEDSSVPTPEAPSPGEPATPVAPRNAP